MGILYERQKTKDESCAMRDERQETKVVLRQAQQPESGGMRCKGSSRGSEGRIKGTTNNTNL